MTTKLSSLDDGYTTGMLSTYPEAIDTKETLYEVKNNAVTNLKASLAYNSKYIIVDDATDFPSNGIVRVGAGPGSSAAGELIWYGQKSNNILKDLVRGFAGSRQSKWEAGVYVTNAVTAEPHNAIKDAILNLETRVGLKDNPSDTSLNGILKSLEVKYLTPKAIFKAYPRMGQPSLKVRFQNFSEGDVIRQIWDFGDGNQSIEKNPYHVYTQEGIYAVKLTIICVDGGQAIANKIDYIQISNDFSIPFFYVTPDSTPQYSTDTALDLSVSPTTFSFVDQTDGDILKRYWIFGDGEATTVEDPSVHTTTHIYKSPGSYSPMLLDVFASQTKRIVLPDTIEVL